MSAPSARALIVQMLFLMASSWSFADDQHCQAEVGEDEASTPSHEFELPRDGSVIHTRTRLQWAQCALGQSWSRDFCAGQAASMTWDEANAAIAALNRSGELAGYTDWRLPSRLDLETIVEQCRETPAINEDIFPNTPWAGFWTSSRDTREANHAWFIGFYSGYSLEYSQDARYRVRPVRTR